MEIINIDHKFSLFSDHWNPRIVGELNGQQVKLAKLKGEFIWHKHEHEDELFYVISGSLRIEFRDKELVLSPGEFVIVPRGIEHRPVAQDEVCVMLFEPASTINTGDRQSHMTRKKLSKI